MNLVIKKRNIRLAKIFTVSFVFILIMLGISFNMIINANAEAVYDAVVKEKKGTMKSAVDNLISNIELQRKILEEEGTFSQEEIKNIVCENIKAQIHSDKYVDDSYMWVNEIINYDGGDRYAIRLIHPNLRETEGQYLSTSTKDIKGKMPYLEELQGLKEHKFIYYQYYFKELNTNKITEKIAYATLYEDYDWAICMGTNVESLERYKEMSTARIKPHIFGSMLIILILWSMTTSAAIFSFNKKDSEFLVSRNKELQNKLNIDTLTGANSRTYGENLLENAFQCQNANVLIGIIDIDDFKAFNDKYGHAIGDKVLRSVTTAIRHSIRITDSVIRWGGDEFVVIVYDVDRDDVEDIALKIKRAVGGLTPEQIGCDEDVTLSMGLTYFVAEDRYYGDAIKRADTALYQVKEAGKNGWKLT